MTESKDRDRKRRVTYQDVLDAPEHMVAEIIDGELFLSPRPTLVHAEASAALIAELRPFRPGRGGPGGWRIMNEPELHFNEDVLVPDVAGWRLERMSTRPEAAYVTLAPDWICEVLSPSTARIDRVRKLAIYAREGVSYAWLVDPLAKTMEIFVRDGVRWSAPATHDAHDRVRAVPFDAIELDLSKLWDDARPTADND